MIFIVRTTGELPNDAGIRVVLTRQTPPEVDVFCTGDGDARARLETQQWTVIALHDGWYTDDHGGGVAVWGGGRYWEVRDSPLRQPRDSDRMSGP